MSQVFYDIEATEKKHRRQSAILTLIVFAIIIFILFLMGLPRMIPPPSEVGIEIALGNSDYGGGEEQPTTIEEVKTVSTPTPQTPNVSEQTVEDVITNSNDESINVQTEENPTPDPVKEEPNEVKEEVKETPKKEPELNASAIASADIFKKNTSQGPNEGINEDVGRKNGSENATAVDDHSTGKGPFGKGNGLNGRSITNSPAALKNECGETGWVYIRITVDAKGNVVDATYDPNGSTIAGACVKRLALEYARRYEFSEDKNKTEQFGRIPIQFVLN
jgi:outer membrane biosynthesis protein TonB